MILFVAGSIGSGKTSRMRSIYDGLPMGSCRGFLSVKSYSSGDFTGYDLLELDSGFSMPLARLSILYKGEFSLPFTFDRFTFDQSAFDYGCLRLIEAATDDKCRSIFIDEIGPMEISGLAFAPALRSLVLSGAAIRKDIYIAARETSIDEICSLFGIESFNML